MGLYCEKDVISIWIKYCKLLVLSQWPHEDRPVLYETASRLTKELTGGIKIEQRCVGSDLPLAGGKTKIPERYQEQMCGSPTSRLYIQPTDKALAYETRRWDACGRVCIT